VTDPWQGTVPRIVTTAHRGTVSKDTRDLLQVSIDIKFDLWIPVQSNGVARQPIMCIIRLYLPGNRIAQCPRLARYCDEAVEYHPHLSPSHSTVSVRIIGATVHRRRYVVEQEGLIAAGRTSEQRAAGRGPPYRVARYPGAVCLCFVSELRRRL